jgi:ATP adenylyltransferase
MAKKTAAKKKGRTAKKKSSSSASARLQIGRDIWPLERDVLFRPDRMKYVRKLVKPEGCVFCRAATEAPSFETLCVYQTDSSMVVLNKFPYNSGHVLVLPRRHCGDLLKLKNEEFLDLNETIRKTMKALQESYEPGGINLGLNHGAVAGAGLPEHLHYHLIPRWSGDLNFFPLIAETKVLVESLEQTYDRLSSYFKRHE